MRIGYYAPELYEMQSFRKDEDYFAYAKWGVVEGESDGKCHIQPYKTRSFFLYDGKLPHEFTADKRWTKLPKGWSYDTDLLASRRTFDEAGHAAFSEWAERSGLDVPETLIEGIERGFFITDCQADVRVEAEISKNCYRLVRKSTPWKQTGTFSVPSNAVFDTYEEALTQAQGRIAATLKQRDLGHSADVINDIRFVLDRVPDGYRKEAEFLLQNMAFPYGFSLRYYDGKVLFRASMRDNWQTVWKVPE